MRKNSKYPIEAVRIFVKPFYDSKDIMHDFTHISRIQYVLVDLYNTSDTKFNLELAELALYFHGIIYSQEEKIKDLLLELNVNQNTISQIVKIAWESQKESKPTTLEGLFLHDAHMLEGGRNFEIIKSLITGSVRGQSLNETMNYIESNVLKKGKCYTIEGVSRYEKMKIRTQEIYNELNIGIGRSQIE